MQLQEASGKGKIIENIETRVMLAYGAGTRVLSSK